MAVSEPLNTFDEVWDVFSSMDKTYNFLTLNDYETLVVMDNPSYVGIEAFVSLKISLSDQEIRSFRHVYTLLDAIGDVGGLLDFFLIFFGVVAGTWAHL